jgi:AcrR family transcriptional regulator
MTEVPNKKSAKRRVLKPKAERHREIVDATVELFYEHGVQGTSISRIADAVGMSKASLYYHFENHEAVLAAAMDAMEHVTTSWYAQQSDEDVPTRLLAMGEAHSEWALSVRSSFLRPLYQVISTSMETAAGSVVGAKKNGMFRRVVEIVEEGKREGTIRAETDSTEVAWAVFLFLWAEDVAALQGDDEFIVEGVSRRLLHRLLAPYFVPPIDGSNDGPGEKET